MTGKKHDDDRINKMVTELMAVPNGDATQGEVIIAFAKAVALLARMIGEMQKDDSDEVLDNIIDLIEGYYDTQTVLITEDHGVN